MAAISICIATHGPDEWRELAWSRAYPSTIGQGAHDVKVVHLPEGTLAQARNRAGRDANGDWLCFLDADDELAPGFIWQMEKAIDVMFGRESFYRGSRALFAPAVQYVQPDGSVSSPAIPNVGRWPDLNECVIGTLIGRRRFVDLGFRDLPSLEDYDLWLRAVKGGATIVRVPTAVYVVHVREGSRNSDQSVYDDLRREHHEVWERRLS